MPKEIICIDDINIEVKRKNVKNINLRIGKDKNVSVSVNKRVSKKTIELFLNSKIEWIKKNLKKMEIYHEQKENVKSIEYISGEVFRIEGVTYKLMVIENNKNKVEVEENIIYLYTTEILNYKMKKNILEKYIKNRALKLFEDSLDRMIDIIKVYGVNKPDMKIRKMKSRWGSCNRTKKKITINLELIKYSKESLDYVMLHELIHFIVPGHNKLFYNYMTVMMPNWKLQKQALKGEYLS